MSHTQLDRAEINRRNSQHSTGPITFEGKRRSCLNALRHGLTGQTIVMPAEDLEAYQAHIRAFVSEHQPQGATETQLVQSLADAAWRLNRVAVLETNLLTHDIIYDDFPNHESTHEMREAIAIAAALDSHTKALANLSIHGQRLSRQFERTLALLQKLQSGRRAKPQMHTKEERSYAAADGLRTDGFVFSDDAQKRGLTTLSPTHAIATGESTTPVDRAVCPLSCASSEIEPFEYLEDRAFRASETQNHHPEAA